MEKSEKEKYVMMRNEKKWWGEVFIICYLSFTCFIRDVLSIILTKIRQCKGIEKK